MTRTKSLLLLSSLLVTFLLLDVSAACGQVPGGWHPIFEVDPEVQQLGLFAVSKHNLQAKAHLKFKFVNNVEKQAVSGKDSATNHRLVISAEDGGVINKYVAIVWAEPPFEHTYKVKYFKPI
ncbi:cysteine proteinase inhibitor 5-like [Cornus florida]|uniref:cysteine proteinase inhibitor 5-like n=1 Tax=Cornus florida TaxID=4283 RepID=UPI00289F6CE6|nr:cysteine proteinase inhibitor 5-like [Cornus florida]